MIWYDEKDWQEHYVKMFHTYEKFKATSFHGINKLNKPILDTLWSKFYDTLNLIPFIASSAGMYAQDKSEGMKRALHDLYYMAPMYGYTVKFIKDCEMVVEMDDWTLMLDESALY